MSFTEGDFLAMLAERTRGVALPESVAVGIGDDAAVLRVAAGSDLVVTTDMLLDGVDFVLADCGPRRAGRKAIAKSLSDLAAMAAAPVAAFAAVALPAGFTRADAAELLDGMLDPCARFGCPLAGGDTKRSSGPLVLSIALAGSTQGAPPVLRSGAREGDALVVTGRLGGAARGHHLDFTPRVAEALELRRFGVRAMIDLSDGLSTDLHRLLAASGAGAVVDAAAIPLVRGADLRAALDDGEDYELLFALPPDAAARLAQDAGLGALCTRIGTVVARERGVTTTGGVALEPRGFEHRFDA